ncbi:acyl-CoA dehydrogenase family protein [Mycobacterium avium]|uniref:acyl-CoA dehydrogenase family protein n=1 Tax=Mycobacterium avium TaxID=1764 RepID=UPI001CC59E03|nr:acyl-CoA dehydrogenase family protein [Mycobacterium avium]MBZ4521830.1 acyl-CoA dehydrogenase [Mycobacterium avium subsp. hominissuis]MBZ4531158.1 acyl-CoA dehydrogenase [Mycobacterium avium subsp. hominissuis]
MNAVTALAGGVFEVSVADDTAELRRLVDDIGRRSFDARAGRRARPEDFDAALWRTLEETGFARLTSTAELGASPAELAVVLRGLARHAGAVPIVETDLLAAWLASTAGLTLPEGGPLTVAYADATATGGRVTGTAIGVPWARAATAVVLAARTPETLLVGLLASPQVDCGHNLAGEPRDRVSFDLPAEELTRLDIAVGDELARRGAWARCMQVIGALDAAAELSVAHTKERVQFGRPLRGFQAVQHALAVVAGEIERARAAATLAVAAACDHGFAAAATDYAVTVAKVVLGRAVREVSTIAHQLHGAIGVTAEHPLWLATLRAQSWVDEFGSTGHHARRLGRVALGSDDVWDMLIGNDLSAWTKPRCRSPERFAP